ncbi:hypothetical protein [Streptomyces telluris]|uniref:Uncharacterized protein n=1 Tax=Streptomyces telluris TaxID=2720021 RepID=A0A9X2LPP8_9ACTN|nr:hypothetical protein [Streptomyces telluris]MCQ8775043.1 hypothetical protein [Streptomyces telluris]
MDNNTPAEAGDSPAGESSEGSASAAELAQVIGRAVVAANGLLITAQSSGATSASRLNVGTYQVCFNTPVTSGTYVASIGLPGNVTNPPSGEISVTGRNGTNNCLFLQTFNSAGALEDRSFHVIVVV